MPVIDVTIVKRDSAPPWPRAALAEYLRDAVWRLAVVEGGMQSGAPSLMLRLDLDDDHAVYAEMSVAAWIMATLAIRGAFPDAFEGGPLEAPGH